MIEETYHIYLNNACIKANLKRNEFEKEMCWLKSFLDLTNLTSSATIEYVVCDAPLYENYLGEPSF